MSLFLVITLTFFFICFVVGFLLSEKPYMGPASNHFNGKHFLNPSSEQAQGFKDVFKFMLTRKPRRWKAEPNAFQRVEQISENNSTQLQYFWVNHSTFLFQFNQYNVLTDPVWSKRCSPFQWAGPARKRPPGVNFEALPRIDLILLSHNHYDHLDIPTLKKLIKLYNPDFIVPLGVASTVKKIGGNVISELDWWQSHNTNQLTIKALPANHFSSRGIFDRDRTLWAGFTIQSKTHKIYFVGDTGYSDIFKEIGEKEGPFDLACIPIGAYLPRWFMSPIHIDPKQAVQVHKDIRSKHSVAMHYGTFHLADDNRETALKDFNEALESMPLEASEFNAILEGKLYLK